VQDAAQESNFISAKYTNALVLVGGCFKTHALGNRTIHQLFPAPGVPDAAARPFIFTANTTVAYK
jgi:hypothetical protein